jgi:hypothetical protein
MDNRVRFPTQLREALVSASSLTGRSEGDILGEALGDWLVANRSKLVTLADTMDKLKENTK